MFPTNYSVTDENLKRSDAIEIKIGQGSKPGMGGHLPAEKSLRKYPPYVESHCIRTSFPHRNLKKSNKDDLKQLVTSLRERSEGRPIGIKIAAGHYRSRSGMDSICTSLTSLPLTAAGGATGASPKYLKDNSTVPTVYALARARAYMNQHHMTQELIITGGFRTSGEMIKALAMGADAIAIASAAMIAIGCQQYRICHNGKCPMGIATQDPELRKNFSIDKGAKRHGKLSACTTGGIEILRKNQRTHLYSRPQQGRSLHNQLRNIQSYRHSALLSHNTLLSYLKLNRIKTSRLRILNKYSLLVFLFYLILQIGIHPGRNFL